MNKKIIMISGIILLVVLSLAMIYLLSKEQPIEITYNEFISSVEAGDIEYVNIKDSDTLIARSINDHSFKIPNPEKTELKEYLLTQNIEVVSGQSSNMVGVFGSIVSILFIGILLFQRNGNKFGKELISDANAKKVNESNIIKFSDVAGNIEAKDMVKDIIDFIKSPEKYEITGARMPKGILLYGPPGTGKTLLAKAIAGEAEVPFYAMSGSDFVQMYVGVGADRIRQLFKKAKKSEKAVIFIDEIDALGKSRGKATSSANDEREQTLNALLTEMSGFNSNEGIVVIGATNRVDTLDEALLRPGRFDRQIEVSLPDKEAREAIIKLYLKNKPVESTISTEEIAASTTMFSGAMLENLINEAAIIAANAEEEVIGTKHMDKAFYNIVAGVEKKESNKLIKDEEKTITAYHEAGHAIATKVLMPEINLAKVSIIPTTKGAAGYNYNIYEDKMYRKRHEIISYIKILLAGRVVEEIVFGLENITTGAVNDIKVASKELYHYYSQYGMDESKDLFFLDSESASQENTYEKCRIKMIDLYNETLSLMKENFESIEVLAEELIEKESLKGEAINKIIESTL